MRGRVAALLSFCFLVSFQVAGDCNLVPRASDNFRQTAWDVAVDDALVWVATGYGVRLHDADGTMIASIALPGETRAIAVRDGVAYAGSGSRVIVLRLDGHTISAGASIDAGATVNDILATTHLFVATDNGIRHYHLTDPLAPVQSNASLLTSSPLVSSLAIHNASLFAADGDSSIEIYSVTIPSLPQRTGAIEASGAVTSVHFANSLLFASDRLGRSTEVFAGSTRVALLPFGANAFASQGHLLLVAGPDRTLRAVDVSLLNRIAKRGEWQFMPTDGAQNAIRALAAGPGEFYVAAGDAGLGIIDRDALTSPFALASYADGAATGVAAGEGSAWFSRGSQIAEQRLVTSGISLVEERTWTAPAGSVIRDLRDSSLLTTTGAAATLWSIGSTETVQIFTVSFPASIVAAVIREDDIAALLPDGTIWISAGGSPTKVATAPAQFLSRGESGIIAAEVKEEGTTVVRWFANGDFSAETRAVTIVGAAVGSIAIEGSRAAAFTFNGVNSIDLETGSVVTFERSNETIPRQLALDAGNILLLGRRSLVVYSPSGVRLREHTLPADTVSFDATGGIAYVATVEGTAVASYEAAAPDLEAPFRNSFYTALAAAGDHLYLFDANGVDIFTTAGHAPRFKTALRSGGLVSIAATPSTLVTVAANLRVTSISPDGVRLAERQLEEGFDATVLAAHAVGEAVWISISAGCLSGGCSSRTLVLDPATLATTATMTGSITDLEASGSRTFVLTEQPDEIRVLNTADPLHPAIAAARERTADATSIAGDQNTVYVLGNEVQTYATSTLSPGPQRDVAGSPSPEQRIRIADGCAVIAGRSDSAELLSTPSLLRVSSVPLPSTVRDVILMEGSFFALTDHSLEWWSTALPVRPARRRAF